MRFRITVGLFFTVVVILFVCMLIFGTGTMADVLRGYESMYQFMDGGSCNTLTYPSLSSPEFSYYIAWWSPGHWLFPYLFICLGIESIQVIQVLLITVCLSLALYGYIHLFKAFGFNRKEIWISMLAILTSQSFYWHTFLYYGGDLLFLSIVPFFVLFLVKHTEYPTWKRIGSFSLLIIAGLIAKNTFVIVIIGGLIFLSITTLDSSTRKEGRQLLLYLLIGAIAICWIYITHLSKGETPASAIDLEGYTGVPNNFIGDISYALGSPIGIFSRFTVLIQKVGGLAFGNFLQLLPLAFMLVFYIRSFLKRDKIYHQVILWFCLPFFCAFSIFFLQDKAISYEMRHFAPIAFVFFPGIIQWLYSFNYKGVITLAIVLFCLVDLGLFALNVKQLNETHLMWNSLKLPKSDVNVLKSIEKWDNTHCNGLIIIDDYWQLSVGQLQNDKVVLRLRNDSVEVVSGMELDHPDKLDDLSILTETYSNILYVVKNTSNWNLVDKIETEEFHKLQEIETYTLIEYVQL